MCGYIVLVRVARIKNMYDVEFKAKIKEWLAIASVILGLYVVIITTVSLTAYGVLYLGSDLWYKTQQKIIGDCRKNEQ